VNKLNIQKRKKSVSASSAQKGVPNWISCTWLRNPCGKKACPVCSLLDEEREKMLNRGESVEFVFDVIDDLRYGVAEAFLSIIEQGQRMKAGRMHSRLARNKRSPSSFKAYKDLDRWHEDLHSVFEDGENQASFWVETADSADLDWYTHIALDYLHRQIMYRFLPKAESLEGTTAWKYTKFVLEQCIDKIKTALNRLALLDSSEKGSLMMLAGRFSLIEKEMKDL
jgi:hypothetical protein